MPTLYLRQGQRYPIEGVVAQSARVTPERIAQAHQTPEGVLLVGKTPGNAVLELETQGQKINVNVVVRPGNHSSASSSWSHTLSELNQLPGVRISALGDKTLVQGEILGRAAYQRVLLHLKNFPKNLLVLALPASGIKESLIEQVHAALAQRNLAGVKVTHAGNRFFLEGSVGSPTEVEQAYEVAQAVLPNIENHVAIPIKIDPTVFVRIFILELSREAHVALGLSWPSSLSKSIVLAPQQFLFNPSWTASLSHLSSRGQAKVLAEPSIAVKNGSHAELSAGGEIPIRITGHFENKVIWRHYGLKIKIHVVGIAGKHVRTKIDTESSHLDEATSVDGVPGLRSSRMSTEVDAIEGVPLLLTGLFQASASKDVDKLPLLGDIPLIGELFKSRRFRDHESELLVALLPELRAPQAELPLKSHYGIEFDKKWRILD
ncbi:MAG: hypothetical protein AB1540_15625 [Bdellovibrionota bacterium]